MPRREQALLALSIGLLAASALGYQVLLFRLLAIVQWHPFVATIVSLALLGHGAAGTALAVAGGRLLPRFPLAYAASAALFALAVPLCWALAQRLPFNGLELVWNPWQLGWLVALFLLLALPFFFAACCFGLAFMHARDRIPALYAADLLGAGLGAGLTTGLLFLLPADDALRVAAAAGACAALLPTAPPLVRLGLPALAVALALCAPADWLAPRVTPYKGLPRTLAVMGAEVVDERSSPYGLLTIVRNDAVPFRHAPGRSLTGTSELPRQLAVFTDGDGMSALTAREDRKSLAWLDETTSALPYRLAANPRVLVLGAGGGTEVLQAIYHGAREVDAVELNPDMLALARTWLQDSGVRWHLGDVRGFIRGDSRQYDLIQMAPLDSYGGSGAGALALAESYQYTVEALADYYDRLAPGGWLALTRWEKQPPRDGLKLFAMAIEMLRARDLEPGSRLALIRGWQTSTLLIGQRPLSGADVGRLRTFCEERGFDPAWFPGIRPDEVNRHHRVPRPWLHEGAVALLGRNADVFLADYKFQVEPATDERPFYFHFFRWSLLPELVALRGQGGLTLLDTGYLVVAATLALAGAPFDRADPGSTRGARPVSRRAQAVASRHLFSLPRARLPVRRDRLHAALRALHRASAVRRSRGAGGFPRVRRRGQPGRRETASPAKRRELGGRRHRAAARGPGHRATAAARHGRGNRRAIRSHARPDCAARVPDGHALSARAVPARDRVAGVHSLGMGHQRLRIGPFGAPRGAAVRAFGLQRGAADGGNALCGGGARLVEVKNRR